jgi:hypothetical protein
LSQASEYEDDFTYWFESFPGRGGFFACLGLEGAEVERDLWWRDPIPTIEAAAERLRRQLSREQDEPRDP